MLEPGLSDIASSRTTLVLHPILCDCVPGTECASDIRHVQYRYIFIYLKYPSGDHIISYQTVLVYAIDPQYNVVCRA